MPGAVPVAGSAAVLPVPMPVVVLVPVLVLAAVPVVPGAHMGPLSGFSSGFRRARFSGVLGGLGEAHGAIMCV
ncbi:hypothetical protein GCM10010306_081920 [Streptomyces umbrinus]|nr:hypothetical protein GCM10010306_081920 [Streptomyces umbrinus]